MNQHITQLRCFTHRETGPFNNTEEYIQHMRNIHRTRLSDTKLRVLAKQSCRRAKMFSSCPLCGKGDAQIDGDLYGHIAGHLRFLAFVSWSAYVHVRNDEVNDNTIKIHHGNISKQPQHFIGQGVVKKYDGIIAYLEDEDGPVLIGNEIQSQARKARIEYVIAVVNKALRY